MAEIVVCRICWNINVKMYKLRDCILENYFIQLLGRFCEPSIPQSLEYVCYECAYLLRKYYLFKEKCLRAQHIFADVFEKSGKITYNDVRSVDREKFKLSSNLVHISNNNYFHYYEYCDIKTEFNTSLETIEGNSLSKIDSVKLEDEIKDDSSNPDFEIDEQIFSAPLEKKPTKRKTGYEKKQLCKKPKLNKESSETSDGHSIRLLNKSANKQVLKKFKARGKQSNLNDQKRRRGPKPTPNGLTPEEMKIQDKFSVRMLTLEEQCEELSKRQQSSNYVNSKFKCDLCYKGFIDSSTYNRHMARHDPANGSIKCSICKMVFQYERHLRNHSRHHNRNYICKTCSFVCKSMTQAKQHQNRHEGKFYKCKICEYVSLKWSSYLSHTRIKHPSEFVCDMCHCSFVSKLGLSKHKTMMHKNGAVLEKRETRGKQQQIKKKPVRSKTSTYCETCNLTCSARNWSKHIASIGHKIKSNEDFTCGVCKETLPSGEALRLHNRRLHPKRRGRSRGNPLLPKTWPAKCPHCSEELPDAPKYYWHFRKVHPDKPYPLIKNYICDVCGKRFKTNAYLVYHRRTHFNDRPYKCKQCPKAFFEKQNLVVHEKWHSDQRPFPCSVCCKAFKTRGALQRHFMLHTGEKPYVCEFCGKAFNQSNSRKGHVKAVHLKEPTSYSRSRSRRAAPDPARPPAHRDEAALPLP